LGQFFLEAKGVGGDKGGGRQGEEMTQAMYAHKNILIKKNKIKKIFWVNPTRKCHSEKQHTCKKYTINYVENIFNIYIL
jgi:hypothetical protein